MENSTLLQILRERYFFAVLGLELPFCCHFVAICLKMSTRQCDLTSLTYIELSYYSSIWIIFVNRFSLVIYAHNAQIVYIAMRVQSSLFFQTVSSTVFSQRLRFCVIYNARMHSPFSSYTVSPNALVARIST